MTKTSNTNSGEPSTTVPCPNEGMAAIKIGYRTLLMKEKIAYKMFKLLAKAEIMEQTGYGDEICYVPTDSTITLELIAPKAYQLGLTNAMLLK